MDEPGMEEPGVDEPGMEETREFVVLVELILVRVLDAPTEEDCADIEEYPGAEE